MTEVTIKTLPRAEAESTVLLLGLDDAVAVRAMGAAMALPCEVSGAAHLPPETAASFSLGAAMAGGRALTALRLEGVRPSVAHRRSVLQAAMKSLGEVAECDDVASRELWRAVRDVTAFASSRMGADRPIWRISTPPASGAALARAIFGGTACELAYDWAGGLVWVMMLHSVDADAALVRRVVAVHGGHATLVRAGAAARAAGDVFEPQQGGTAALTKRVKESFDPKRVLNPGRMWAGV
jgi:glycolate oxidase FAD binding subunit